MNLYREIAVCCLSSFTCHWRLSAVSEAFPGIDEGKLTPTDLQELSSPAEGQGRGGGEL